MKKKELLERVKALDLKMSILMQMNEFDLENYIEEAFYEEKEESSDEVDELRSFLDEVGPIQFMEQLHGLDNEMFTAQLVIYLPNIDRYLMATCGINSYDNCIDDEYNTPIWSVVKPKTRKVTVYE